MTAVRTAELPILTGAGDVAAVLHVHLLPRTATDSDPSPLIDKGEDHPLEALARIQLLESTEYRYRVSGVTAADWTLEPTEFFEPDDESGLEGRLRPGLATGRVVVRLSTGGSVVGYGDLEVRAKKLDYLNHYRWMLADIAELMTELIMDRFSAAEQKFAPDEQRSAETAYQRFEFLRAMIGTAAFDAAIQRILASPYVSWESQGEPIRPEQGVKGSSQVLRQLARPGPRATLMPGAYVSSVPATIQRDRTDVSRDNAPNRFVRFAVERWRDVALTVEEAIRGSSSPALRRGAREASLVLTKLETILREPLFHEVGPLHHFPAESQVLQKKEGYRDVFRYFIESEIAAKLAWTGGDNVYAAGKRNVATLYEYWAFLQLAKAVRNVCDGRVDLRPLISLDPSGLTVSLTKGRTTQLSGLASKNGRVLYLDLWFNRGFSAAGPRAQAWSQAMRPDATLHIRSSPTDQTFVDAWLHFDAKYRVDTLAEVMGPIANDAQTEQEVLDQLETFEEIGTPKRADLLKMHAYRDAILKSVGAYVMYPGDVVRLRQPYDEILPGLGAFALRPSEGGQAQGQGAVETFLFEVVEHLSRQYTGHERERYWTRRAHSEPAPRGRIESLSVLRRPPADTLVLLGYVRSEAHHRWVTEIGLYNLRADARRGAVSVDSRELAAELLVLYGQSLTLPQLFLISGSPRILTKEDLIELGYPQPRGELYFCLPIESADPGMVHIPSLAIEALQREKASIVGEPVTVTCADVLRVLGSGLA